MRRQTLFLAAALIGCLLLATAALAQTAGSRDQASGQEVKDALRVLMRQLDSLHDEIVSNLAALGARDVFAHAQNVLANFVLMERTVDRNASWQRVREDYARADQNLNELLTFVEGLGPSYASVRRAAARVRAAERELHFAVYGDLPGARTGEVLERQSHGLADGAQDLEKAAAYALSGTTRAGNLLTDLRDFVKAARTFDQRVKGNKSQEEQRRAFREVLSGWDHVVLDLRKLPARENVYLLRTASRVDNIQERLFGMLKMPGRRSRLSASVD